MNFTVARKMARTKIFFIVVWGICGIVRDDFIYAKLRMIVFFYFLAMLSLIPRVHISYLSKTYEKVLNGMLDFAVKFYLGLILKKFDFKIEF